MPLPIIPDTYMVRLLWTDADAPRTATNTFHIIDVAGTNDETDVYNALNAAVTQNLWITVGLDAKVETVQITKLDGISASQSFATGGPAKWTAGASGESILQGAVVVSLKSAKRGPKYRNRIYLPWTSEGAQTNGTIGSSQLATAQTAWDTFVAALETVQFPIAVVSPSVPEANDVVQAVVRPFLRTQRRRVRR